MFRCIIIVLSLFQLCLSFDTSCNTLVHPNYGSANCIDEKQCANRLYVSGLCESLSSSIKCCLSLKDTIKQEFRAIWIATVNNMDWPSSSNVSISQQQTELIDILNMVERLNMNAVVFQVRPAGDALYASSLEPWSIYLTGAQGISPSPLWDPLAFIVDEAHKRNIEVHAWINPYRARYRGETYELAPNHMARRFPKYAYSYANQIWMDPASSEVQNFIGKVVEDIVQRYAINGIHMDDYFYPYGDGTDFPDNATYARFLEEGGRLNISDWRRMNVNSLINSLYARIHAIRPRVKFGISPFGIWKSNFPPGITGLSSYDSLYCDSRMWLEQGLVDYLSPQLYWQIDPPQQSYSALLNWWTQQSVSGRHVYPGNAIYRLNGTSDWPVTEIVRQVNITRMLSDHLALGNIFFSATELKANIKGIQDQVAILYKDRAITPIMNWL